MKTLKLLAASALIGTVCATAVMADDTQPSKTTANFLKNAAIGGKFEVDSSNIVLQKSNNNDVKTFAQKMVDDHTKANDELKSTIAAENLPASALPDQLDAKHQALLDKLNADSSGNFDKDYIKAQTDAHKDAVALFAKYAKNGDEPAIKTFAANTLPTLEHHKAMVADLKAK